MIRYLIHRPVAVLISFLAVLIAGMALLQKIPVSLLPSIDVPRIVIVVNYPNTPAAQIQQNVIRPIQEAFAGVSHLANIESETSDHTGSVYLTFDYGTRMDLAYIEVNEKIDLLSNSFPRDMPRPQVMRINTSDIPVLHIQVIPSPGTNMSELSTLAEKYLRRRIEQLDGVSLVDMNGLQHSIVSVNPDKQALAALGEDESILSQTIRSVNQDLGRMTVQEGHYRYFVTVSNTVGSINELSALPVRLRSGSIVPLKQLAVISSQPETISGCHLFNGKQGIVITVGKRSDSKMNVLVPKLKSLVNQFTKHYPDLSFSITQDQTFLLDAGISNLYQDIIIGGILTISLLFLFLGNWASPTLMSISIPVSLVLTFLFFYSFHLSFNIISLSGLALGIGMLIDNSIIVVDNITKKYNENIPLTESCITGTNEVVVPVISQVLTTVAVYAPLVLLNGMASSLVADQSIALTISLAVSLLVAFILCPILYNLFMKGSPQKKKTDTIFYIWISKGYHKMVYHLLKHKGLYFFFTIALMPIGFLLVRQLPVSALPTIEKRDGLILLDWNTAVYIKENLQRTNRLLQVLQPFCETTEAEIGLQQFLQQQEQNSTQKLTLYYSCKTESLKKAADESIQTFLTQNYSNAFLRIIDAPNAFVQLFNDNTPWIEARLRPVNGDWSNIDLPRLLSQLHQPWTKGLGMIRQRNMRITLDYQKMALYGVSRAALEDKLQQLFGIYTITEMKHFGDVKTVRLQSPDEEQNKLNTAVKSGNGQTYPLKTFIGLSYEDGPRFITADKAGIYQSVSFDENTTNIDELKQQLTPLAATIQYDISYQGRYFSNKEQINKLWLIFWVVLFLLYAILAIQYEDLLQPLIVMLTIPLGIFGSSLLLYLTGQTLNVMTCVGFIVILGLIVDDPTLKVDVLNRLFKKHQQMGKTMDDSTLEELIHEAGEICLKPLLMVSLTTTIAMVPVLLVGGIGNDLQKPLAIVIIGGLTLGTFFTTWFIPIAYWYLNKLRK